MEWLREDIRQIRNDVMEILGTQAAQGERLATIEERIEAINRITEEHIVTVRKTKAERAGIVSSIVIALSSLAASLFK